MKYFTVAIYITLSDMLHGFGHKEDKQRRIDDATILTTLVIASKYYSGPIEHALSYMKSHHYPGMLCKSQFSRRMHHLKDRVIEVFELFAGSIKQINQRQYYFAG